jgi:hypothetical protein
VGTYTLDGSCTNGLRIAQLVSLGAFVLCGVVLAWRHRPDTGHRDQTPPTIDLGVTDG